MVNALDDHNATNALAQKQKVSQGLAQLRPRRSLRNRAGTKDRHPGETLDAKQADSESDQASSGADGDDGSLKIEKDASYKCLPTVTPEGNLKINVALQKRLQTPVTFQVHQLPQSEAHPIAGGNGLFIYHENSTDIVLQRDTIIATGCFDESAIIKAWPFDDNHSPPGLGIVQNPHALFSLLLNPDEVDDEKAFCYAIVPVGHLVNAINSTDKLPAGANSKEATGPLFVKYNCEEQDDGKWQVQLKLLNKCTFRSAQACQIIAVHRSVAQRNSI